MPLEPAISVRSRSKKAADRPLMSLRTVAKTEPG
jgi:hypothetical protein